MNPVWLWWSGGKDSAWALEALRRSHAFTPTGLVTTLSEDTRRVPFHGIHESLLVAQARSLGIRLHRMPIPQPCPNIAYESAVDHVIEHARETGVSHMAFGDLYLRDIRQYRESLLDGSAVKPLFPIWGRDTRSLALAMLDAGLSATVTGIDTGALDASFLGRAYNRDLIDDLPAGVDPCGENGEFHTFVHQGPGFVTRVEAHFGRPENTGNFITLPANDGPARESES